MQHLLCDDLWQRLKQLDGKCKRRLAAVAFYSNGKLLRFGNGDVLVVDGSDGRIKSGDTSADALAIALRRKAQVFSLAGLHAKVFLFDQTAVVGSANVSQNSRSSLIEAALVTDEPTTVSQAKALIDTLVRMAKPIDSAFIRRIRKIPVRRRALGKRMAGANRKVGKLGRRTWLVGVRELDPDAFPAEAKSAEAGEKVALAEILDKRSEVSWIRLTGKSRFQRTASKGDSVIEIWKPLRGVIKVQAAAPILHRQSEPTCTRFYVEDRPGRDKNSLSLRTLRKLAKQVGLTGKIGDNSQRCLTEDKARLINLTWNNLVKKPRRTTGKKRLRR